MSNMKQIGLGVAMYAQDYDDCYPTLYSAPKLHHQFFSFAIGDYLNLKQDGSGKVWICPNLKVLNSAWLIYKKGNTADANANVHYRPNQANAFNGGAGQPWSRQHKTGRLKYPSSYVVLGEVNPGSWAYYFCWDNEGTNKKLGLCVHPSGSTYLRGDGHVDVYKIHEAQRGMKNDFFRKMFFPNGFNLEWPGQFD